MALQRVESAAARLAADGDPESKALARQLRKAMLTVQSLQDQARAVQEIDAQKANLATPDGGDYNKVFREINQQNVSRYHIGM